VSVVTNALRLRGFRRPTSAHEILHPARATRVRDYGYLVAIGLVALAVGAVALGFATRGGATDSGMVMSQQAAASSAQVSRAISLSITNDLRFTPDALTVRAGETIAFTIANPGTVPHEFVIGDEGAQAQHEREMASTSSGAMPAEPNAVQVAPGKTAVLIYTFDKPGSLIFGCHVAGHYAAGMRGTITVTQ